MGQETEWSDDLSARAKETAFASLTPVDRKAAEAAVAEEWKEGDVILDLYEVRSVLGEGGFGKVYRVRHKGWNIDLAVKTPRLDRLDEAGKENFRNEAETWVNLGLHPHTVSCYYVRDLGGIPRVFAEYVEGGSLSDWIRMRKLYEGGKDEALKRILDIAIQFAWGLHYAHEQGLVHQDVKPANVMMTPEGVAKVTDFGLAKARGVAGGKGQSESGESVLVASGGMTPAYASPEQSAGRSLSRATDIWSWAVSVLEMFTGEVTWMSGSAAADALEEFATTGAEYDSIPTMPESVSKLLRDCFNENVADRPKHMLLAASVLEEVYRDVTTENYSRKVSQGAKGIADSLNNRAVSLLDLGNYEEATKRWDEALLAQPHHPESTYNRGLLQWRDGKQNDLDFLAQMQEAIVTESGGWRAKYLTARAQLERGDADAAIRLLEEIRQSNGDIREVDEALAVAKEALPLSISPVAVFEKVFKSDDEGYLTCLALNADRSLAVLGNDRGKLWLLNIPARQLVRTFDRSAGESADWGGVG